MDNKRRFLLTLIGLIFAIALMIIIIATGFTASQEITIVKAVICFLLICVNYPLSDRPLGYSLTIIWSLALALNLLALVLVF